MSQYSSGHYQRSPPQHGQQDQYGRYQQPGQNGGHQQQPSAYPPEQQPPTQYSYPGQPAYNPPYPGGGAVQQPQPGYAYQEYSPRNASYPGGHQPQHPQQYDPQNYAQPARSPPQPSYNPAAYASFTQSGHQPSQYSTAAYAEAPLHGTSGPVDPYAYSPGNYTPASTSSHSAFSPHSQYGQSPHQGYSPQQPQYNSQTPADRYSYAPTQSPPPAHSHYYTPSVSQASGVPYPTAVPPYSGSVHVPYPSAGAGGPEHYWSPRPPAHIGLGQSPSTNQSGMSPPSSTPGPTPPAHGSLPVRSNTWDRHPQDRPLPPQPGTDLHSDYFEHSSRPGASARYNRDDDDDPDQEDLFEDIENVLYGNPRASHSPSIAISQAPSAPPFSASRISERSTNGVNGHLSPVPQSAAHQPAYASDSDAEAAHGNAMMREHEARERLENERPSSGQLPFNGLGGSQGPSRTPHTDGSDSEDYGLVDVDISTFGGGEGIHITYGGNPNQLVAGGEVYSPANSQPVSSQHSSMRRSHASQSSQLSRNSYDHRSESIHPFPPFNPAARVEVGGTGGLAEPSAIGRRQSYDEGDEYSLMESHLPERFPDEPPDIPYHQASSSFPSRPLPAVPYQDNKTPPGASKALPPLPGQGPNPSAPDAYMINAQGQYVPRSTSLISHSNTPQVMQPLRSKTDAEERRKQQARLSGLSTIDSTPASGSMLVDLPAIGKRFSPSKLGAPDFKKCIEPWSLMSLLKWLLQVTSPEQNTELKEADIKEALVALFTNKVPTMNIADAEGLSCRVVEDMYDAGTLVTTEEWVRLVPGYISGVIFQLSQAGCYSPTVHNHIIPNMRCYSHLCQRTLKKINLQTHSSRSVADWAGYYNLKKEDVDGKDKKEIEKQNVLHEVVTTEEKYMDDLEVLQTLYRDQLARVEPSVITPKRKDKFLRDVFGRVDPIKLANEEHLLPQLKYRQMEQGPWIVGYSDIFRQWIRKAKAAYVEYANDFPRADYMVRQEMERNIEFKLFVDRAQRDKKSSRLAFDSFLKSPITRLQRYPLLLSQISKTMKDGTAEKANLMIAVEEVKAVAMECDTRVAEQQRKIDMSDLGHRLVLRPGMEKEVELNLEHFGRALIHRGDLQRMGSNRFTWLDCHAILFDHYMIIAKSVAQRTNEGGKRDMYDVSRLPIPMDLLIVDSANDPPVQKSSYIKGITSVREAAGRNTPSDPAALARTPSNQFTGPGTLAHTNTAASSNSLTAVTSLGEGKDSDRILYPFRIKHLGRDTYTLFALTEQARKDWTTKIIEGKTKHAAALHAQNAEPFRLRVMADSAFVYDAYAGSGKGVLIKGTPMDRAIKDVEHRFKDTGRPGPVCRARVNCATSFTTPYPGRQMVAIGTEYGVFVSELDNPRGWIKAINMSRVTQVAVLEDFNLFLLISDKSLIAYHLDAICPSDRSGPTPINDSARKAPQKLSGSRDVGFFVAGRMKDRTLVFYKKRENLNSVFKVLEPVYQKSTEKKRVGMFKRGNTEFFREYDEFYIPTECRGMDLFHSSLAVSTSRGFEVLTLDKKQPWSVPELKADHVQNIAQRIREQVALSMLRLSEQEFLLVYANCAVYVNKHGDVSRSVVMEFVGHGQNAAIYGPYLVLFNEDFVEIRNAQNGRLKQIIAGREIKCLDDGTNWSANGGAIPPTNGIVNGPTAQAGRTLKLVMQHPEQEKNQIVVELLLNENMKE
ncbi:Rho1 guanine nucleotide exchange factor 3 [Lecanosticta acicola]|uniref:Rho1 guanine nucleotide exchange factor 3 n=1 Tax=Lecanosticta acicola TaxID=111012 RepID=A0AAI8Z5R0_9PEZI|nr:Rho1 guanine nucleotide exchange factor 3 [Lecanosticta acicola]